MGIKPLFPYSRLERITAELTDLPNRLKLILLQRKGWVCRFVSPEHEADYLMMRHEQTILLLRRRRLEHRWARLTRQIRRSPRRLHLSLRQRLLRMDLIVSEYGLALIERELEAPPMTEVLTYGLSEEKHEAARALKELEDAVVYWERLVREFGRDPYRLRARFLG